MGGVKKKNWKRQADVYENRDWMGPDDEKKIREDDTMEYKINHPNFEYNPVVQPVDFQATGGINNKNKDPSSKEYGKPGWDRLKKNPNENPNSNGPNMGKGKIPNDPNQNEKVKLKPFDYSKWKEPIGDNIMKIYIDCPDGTILTLNVKKEEPLHYIKKQIENKKPIYPENKQILYYNFAELLNNNATL